MNTNEQVNLRIATNKDLELVKYWDQQQHVIDSDPDDDWDWEYELNRFPDWRAQFIAEINGRAIGFIQIIDPKKEDSQYWGDVPDNQRAIDIWIGEQEDLGKGYGTQMMKLAIDYCFNNDNVNTILIDPLVSNTKAIRFYEKIGFHYVENRFFGKSECVVYKLDRKHWFSD
ncbi:GNAT family N-acetyltransferase [Aquimarina aggregata]|uniref:GNAT family N-acetyltransferase n=1 Tax=Aquimarina aggregata TaxID=1642818 RepID=UPI00249229FD|nr:GNAT family N-acetyltransferase [Aquimarina aggregata]